MTTFCTNCGAALAPATRFCSSCGTEAAARPQPMTSMVDVHPPSANTMRTDGHNSTALPSPPSLHWGFVLALSVATLWVFSWIWGFGQTQTGAGPTRGSSNSDWLWIGIFLVVVLGGGFFSIPTIVAFSRRHRNRWAILVLNLAFGVTLIGWVIALIWALNKVDDPIKGGVKMGPPPPDPVL